MEFRKNRKKYGNMENAQKVLKYTINRGIYLSQKTEFDPPRHFFSSELKPQGLKINQTPLKNVKLF